MKINVLDFACLLFLYITSIIYLSGSFDFSMIDYEPMVLITLYLAQSLLIVWLFEELKHAYPLID